MNLYLGKCQFCNTQGHNARKCPQLSGYQPSSSPAYSQASPPWPHSPAQSAPPHWQTPSPPPQWQAQDHYTTSTPSDQAPWLLDSGASHHIASNLSNLSLQSPYNGGDDVHIGDGSGLKITHTGSTSLPSSTRPLLLSNVPCVPSIKKNLISVHKLCKANNVMVQLCPSTFQVKDLKSEATMVQGRADSGLYEWPAISNYVNPSSVSPFLAFSCVKSTLSEWHSRLGHPAIAVLKHIASRFNLPVLSSSNIVHCNACSSNKSHKLPFMSSSLKSSGPLDLLYTDVWTSPVYSVDSYKYYVVFVEHFPRYVWLYPLKKKSDVLLIFPPFKQLVENRFKQKLTTLYSDNGGEFITLAKFLAAHDISHLTSPPHMPEHNGMAERRRRHIVETGLSLLTHAGMLNTYWSYAFAVAVYLINRMPTPMLNNSSPFQLLFQQPPNYIKLRSFGCVCYPWLRPYSSHKLSPKSKPYIFLGYSLTQSAYMCLEASTNRIYTSRHVEFFDTVFPFSSFTSPSAIVTPPLESSPSYFPTASVVPHHPLHLLYHRSPRLELLHHRT